VNQQTKTLLCILGPTAVGKTATAIRLAKRLKTEIISADSRQFYKEISIGTAKPNNEELEEVPHHFIGHLSIEETYNAGQFERDALALLNELF
jgi:tRNA dimethylallyltransferase